MNEAKPTLGPWIASDKVRDDSIVITTTIGGYEVGEIYAWEDVPEESRANAKLAAAAPELLQALQAMVTEFEGCSADRAPALITARAAITKATQ